MDDRGPGCLGRSDPPSRLGLVVDPTRVRGQAEGYRLVGLEQTSGACSLYQFSFARQSALVVGNERSGITEEVLKLLDDVVEIPVYGLPYSHNAATATAIALYEYCRQFPNG